MKYLIMLLSNLVINRFIIKDMLYLIINNIVSLVRVFYYNIFRNRIKINIFE